MKISHYEAHIVLESENQAEIAQLEALAKDITIYERSFYSDLIEYDKLGRFVITFK